jgi:4a-hydroxytetrahydrobiopterin dehydratase
LHGGATAVFRVASLREAVLPAEAVSQVPGVDGSRAILPVTEEQLSVRLSRGVFRLEESHIDIARAVSATAQAHGAVAERDRAQEVQVALGHGSTVWMQELGPSKPLRHAMHIDVSVPREHAEARVAAALAAGGRIVHDADAPDGWIVADRAGNRVCIAAWPDGGFTSTTGPQ